MSSARVQTTVAGIKLLIFVVISIIVTGTLAMIMGGFGRGSQTEYKAIFSSATELKSGDDVRIAGVTVGEVNSVDFYHRAHALVTFSIDKSVPLNRTSTASIRFLNLVGDRYMSLEQGRPTAPRLHADAVIPMSRTTPALNLTALFDGFQPLFQALEPHEVNQLAMNLIRVLQGEGGTVQQLLTHTASLTNSLADRDRLIGQVITNLDQVMRTVNDHHQQLRSLIIGLRDWTGSLARDRGTIGASLQNVSSLSATLADLLTRARPWVKSDVHQLRRLFTILASHRSKAKLDQALRILPVMLERQTRIGTYGSWYNYYLCSFKGGVVLPAPLRKAIDLISPGASYRLANMTLKSNAARCQG